ncbi:ATP-binding cassette domain-containing protein [Micromonospora sp. M12]
MLSAVGLDDRRRSRIRTLSGGMKQRLALAAALVGDPDLVILDEPTVGLDPEQRLRFRELIADLGERKTVLLSTHQTEDVMSLCQEVIVLDRGRVRFEGTRPSWPGWPPAGCGRARRGRPGLWRRGGRARAAPPRRRPAARGRAGGAVDRGRLPDARRLRQRRPGAGDHGRCTMTATSTVAAPAHPVPSSTDGRRHALLALARFESVRMLRHPLTIAAALLFLAPWLWAGCPAPPTDTRCSPTS